MDPTRQVLVESLRKAFSDSIAIDFARHVMFDEVANRKFRRAIDDVAEVARVLAALSHVDYARLAESQIKHIAAAIAQLDSVAASMIGYDEAVDSDGSYLAVVIDKARRVRGRLVPRLASLVAQAVALSGDIVEGAETRHIARRQFEEYVQKNKDAIAESLRAAEAEIASVKPVVEQARKAIEEARRLAGRAGSWEGSDIFEDASKEYARVAGMWLRAAGAGAVVLIGAALWFLFDIRSGLLVSGFGFDGIGPVPQVVMPTSILWMYGLGKLGVLSFLAYIVVWCGGNYSANKHGEVVSKHRQHALRTYEVFVLGAKDPNIQDAVLQYAAQTVFLGRASGFERHPDGGGSLQPIVDSAARAAAKAATHG